MRIIEPAKIVVLAVCCLFAALFFVRELPAQQSTATIAGRITLPDGAPVAGIRVGAIPVEDALGRMTLVGLSQTDPDGQFRLVGIPPGRYYLLLGSISSPFYFPGVTSQADATVVTAAAGALETREFRLRRPLTLKVSGRVVREGHEQGKWVTLSDGASPEIRAAIEADGSFTLTSVRPGTYKLTIGPNIDRPPVRLVVDDRDISGIEVVLPQSAVRSAAVTFVVDLEVEGNPPRPLPDFWLTFDRNDLPELFPPLTIMPPGETFVSEMPFAEYRAHLSSPRSMLSLNRSGALPPGYTVKGLTSGPTDLLKEPLKITASGDVAIAVRLVFSPPAVFKVSGRVTGLAAAPVKADTVSISGLDLESPLRSSVAPDGSFQFAGVLPGVYRLSLIPQGDPFPRSIVVGDADLTDVEIPMIIPARKVSGRIVDIATLRPLGPNNSVALELSMTGTWPVWPWSARSIARSDGSFAFDAVQPGTYDLTVFTCRFDDCVSASRPLSVDITDKDITGWLISVAER
jgi:hypothetical protein